MSTCFDERQRCEGAKHSRVQDLEGYRIEEKEEEEGEEEEEEGDVSNNMMRIHIDCSPRVPRSCLSVKKWCRCAAQDTFSPICDQE